MSDGINRVILLGDLGADPELRFTQAGMAVLGIRMATHESYMDKDKVRQERTEWHSVIVWGKRGEGLAKLLTKGSRILVEGSLRTTSYEDRDNNKRYKTEIVANNIVFAGGRGTAPGNDSPSEGGEASTPPRAQRPSPVTSGGPTAGDFVVKFGRDKGKKISEVPDLAWLRSAIAQSLDDPSRAQYHDSAKKQLASIDAEIAKRSGGTYLDNTSPADDTQEAPASGVSTSGDFDDDDVPF